MIGFQAQLGKRSYRFVRKTLEKLFENYENFFRLETGEKLSIWKLWKNLEKTFRKLSSFFHRSFPFFYNYKSIFYLLMWSCSNLCKKFCNKANIFLPLPNIKNIASCKRWRYLKKKNYTGVGRPNQNQNRLFLKPKWKKKSEYLYIFDRSKKSRLVRFTFEFVEKWIVNTLEKVYSPSLWSPFGLIVKVNTKKLNLYSP